MLHRKNGPKLEEVIKSKSQPNYLLSVTFST